MLVQKGLTYIPTIGESKPKNTKWGNQGFIAPDSTTNSISQTYVKVFEPLLVHIVISKLELFAELKLKEGVVYNIAACLASPNA